MFTFVIHAKYISLALSLHCHLGFTPRDRSQRMPSQGVLYDRRTWNFTILLKRASCRTYAKGTLLFLSSRGSKISNCLQSYYFISISLALTQAFQFQTFPSQYFSLPLNLLYLALEDGSPIFQQVNTRCTYLIFS